MTADLVIRPAVEADHAAVLRIVREVVTEGTSYFFDDTVGDDELLKYWTTNGWTYVAERAGEIVGCYIIRPNYPARGRHVCNASYAVSSTARGAGVGRAMGEHSLDDARALGFTAMQFNRVVSTNDAAVRLWRALGFEIAGTLPRVFEHPQHGLVDAYVMHRWL